MEYLDRLTPGTEFTTGEGVDVGVMRPGEEVEELGFIHGPLFHRAQRIAAGYYLHVLPGVEFYGESALVKAQCETLVNELTFVSGIVNDDVLREALVPLREAALRVVRSPTEMFLILVGP
jgi:hypothetical protein